MDLKQHVRFKHTQTPKYLGPIWSTLRARHVRAPQTMADLRFSSGEKFWGPVSSAFSFKCPKPQLPVLCCHSAGGKDSEGSQAVPLNALRALACKSWFQPGESATKVWLVGAKIHMIINLPPLNSTFLQLLARQNYFRGAGSQPQVHVCRAERPLISSAC